MYRSIRTGPGKKTCLSRNLLCGADFNWTKLYLEEKLNESL